MSERASERASELSERASAAAWDGKRAESVIRSVNDRRAVSDRQPVRKRLWVSQLYYQWQ